VATVQQALANLAAAYASDAGWPEKGTDLESSGAIIILGPDPVSVTAQIAIDNNSSAYPSIILCDDPAAPGGKLQATAAIGSMNANVNSLLLLKNKAKVTLEGGLVLEGTGNTDNNIRGVFVYDSTGTFTMNGGEISNYSSAGYGGGVFSTGTFTMNGGEISGNSVSYSSSYGGGVYSFKAFTMTGGVISGNSSSSYGGGVYADGTFTMYNGEISGNSTTYGGGVYQNAGTFTMSGGVISGNTASAYGGGVGMPTYNSSIFEKTGGTIYGYDPEDPYSNKVQNPSGTILDNYGHAVYIDSTYRKEAAVGPTDDLTYNYHNSGDHSGW
jgi:predicted outer membrane repeat protein